MEHIGGSYPIRVLDVDDVPKLKLVPRTVFVGPILDALIKEDAETWKALPTPVQYSAARETAKALVPKRALSAVKYAIFSHRWLTGGEKEVVFSDLSQPRLAHGPGRKKLMSFCRTAKDLGFKYVWCDTACIDKSSSSELEESIRSMFKWYWNASICIVYLSDTKFIDRMANPLEPWFTRGWTLQELISPRAIKFYDKDWEPLDRSGGDNDKRRPIEGKSSIDIIDEGIPSDELERLEASSLWKMVSQCSGISVKKLVTFKPGVRHVREVLSWMANRHTTRVEDMAYSLIGVFDINLSTTYGEDDRAFYR